jgi:hypothetical protein
MTLYPCYSSFTSAIDVFFNFNFFCNLLSSHLNRLTDFNGVVLVQNYLERTGRGSWAKQVPYLENTFIYSH